MLFIKIRVFNLDEYYGDTFSSHVLSIGKKREKGGQDTTGLIGFLLERVHVFCTWIMITSQSP